MGRKILFLAVTVGVLVSMGCIQTENVSWSWKSTVKKPLCRIFQSEDGSTYILAGGFILMGEDSFFDSYYLCKMDEDGKLVWKTEIEGEPKFIGNRIFAGAPYPTEKAMTSMIDPENGKVLVKVEGEVIYSKFDDDCFLILKKCFVVYKTIQQKLTKINAEGRILWSIDVNFNDATLGEVKNSILSIYDVNKSNEVDIFSGRFGNPFKTYDKPSDNYFDYGFDCDNQSIIVSTNKADSSTTRTLNDYDYNTGKLIKAVTFVDDPKITDFERFKNNLFLVRSSDSIFLRDIGLKKDVWSLSMVNTTLIDFNRETGKVLLLTKHYESAPNNYVFSLMDVDSGNIDWSRSVQSAESYYATKFVDDFMIVSFADNPEDKPGRLYCLGRSTGELLWERDGCLMQVQRSDLTDKSHFLLDGRMVVTIKTGKSNKQRMYEIIDVETAKNVCSITTPNQLVRYLKTNGNIICFASPDVMRQYDTRTGVQIRNFIDDRALYGEDVNDNGSGKTIYTVNHACPQILSSHVCFLGEKGTGVYDLYTHKCLYYQKNKSFESALEGAGSIFLLNDKEVVSIKIP